MYNRLMSREWEEKFLKAYDQTADSVFRYCLLRCSDREVALDLTQEVFTRTWDYIVKGGNPLNMRAFLFRVARNAVIDYYRKAKPVSLDAMREETGFDVAIPATSSSSAEVANLRRLVEQLDEDYREVIIMRYVHDLSIQEIAEALGERENTVSVRLSRAVGKLRQIYK